MKSECSDIIYCHFQFSLPTGTIFNVGESIRILLPLKIYFWRSWLTMALIMEFIVVCLLNSENKNNESEIWTNDWYNWQLLRHNYLIIKARNLATLELFVTIFIVKTQKIITTISFLNYTCRDDFVLEMMHRNILICMLRKITQ